jgi:hypothetical protein
MMLITAVLVPLGGMALANHGGACLDLSPESASNPQNATHVVAATLRTPAGQSCGSAQTAVDPSSGAVTIFFEITGANDPDAGNSLTTPDKTCTIQPGETSCAVSYAGPNLGTDTIRGWVEETGGVADADEQEGAAEGTTPGRLAEADATDVVTKTWVNPATSSDLDCAPETATNPAGTSHTVGCTVRDPDGVVVSGARVDIEATGANDPDGANSLTTPDFTCTTVADGTCTFTHGTGTSASGTTTYRAWVDADNSNATVEADQTEGNSSSSAPGSVPEGDNTDVVTKTWTPGPAVGLDCDDMTGPDTEHESNPGAGPSDPASAEVYTCTVVDAAGNPASGSFTVLGEDETATHDPDNPDSNSTSTPDYQCATTAGTCQITVTQSENELGATNICFWVGTTGAGATLCASEAIGESQAAGGADTGNDFADKVEVTWEVPTGRTIACAPATGTTATGLNYNVTCTVRDRFGRTLSGQGVVFTTSGPGTLTTATTVVTNQFGQATVTATSLDPGVQTITGTLQTDLTGAEPGDVDDCDRVANDPAGSPAGVCSSSVTHTWTQAAVATVTLTPDEMTTRVGGRQTYTFQARDANGVPVAGVPVSWTMVGTGAFVSTDAETNANGTARAVATSDQPGDTTILASVPGCSGTCSDFSRQHWGPIKCTIFGSDGRDTLRGTRGPDTICGFGNSDTILGRGGRDVILGGGDGDTIRGGAGTDSLKGGSGNDQISGGKASDFLYGGPGNDVLNGNEGIDGCRPGPGRDVEKNCEGSIVGRQRT